MRTTRRDIFETLCKENWQDAGSAWILRLRNKNQKAEHRLGELSTVAEDPCSAAGGGELFPARVREHTGSLRGLHGFHWNDSTLPTGAEKQPQTICKQQVWL